MKKVASLVFVFVFAVLVSGCTGKTSSNLPFPIPASVLNMAEQEDSQNFQTSMGLEEAQAFYKSELTAMGLIERELNTVATDTTFSMVYDGYENGIPIVVQGVVMDEKSVNINIRFEEI